ncbi:SDR family NAD(P)-dependent oxidoreductase [Streptomyces sp. NPDC046942]|uniref:SDR family NAD(P)-dependent oxidoreductase n=1 Tax=Streptomyces sp. NPDC046942 TaxID=3155137 RepID=UPI0033EF7685
MSSSTNVRDILDGYARGAVDAAQARSLLAAGRPAPAAEPPPAGPDPARPLDIAVIGMAGQFPGAPDIRTLWHNLTEGLVSYGELPEHYRAGDGPGTYRWGGALAERDCFDPEFFGIRPHEADLMSHHQRLLLQESWHALEDAALDPRALAGSRTGLFIGAEPTGYPHESFVGASDALVASRLSYFLDLRGSALVVNTACSSSLAAVHLACQSLRSGESSLALAGGVNAGLDARGLDVLVDSGAMSPTGACRTFDADADGTVYSEAVAVVVLKRLADAVADGDHVYGVIRATGLNQDGASNGITAPNGAAQEDLVLDVYRSHGIQAERIGYVEAHGTGTALGDPVEANALVRAFRKLTDARGFCTVGSVKSYIGHTGAPAGVVGLIKVLLSMRYGLLPGMPTLRRLNPLIGFADSAFVPDQEPRPWRSSTGAPLMAAVNSFGHSGTNAHLVVEQYVPAAASPAADDGAAHLVPLSALDTGRLRALARVLADHLATPPAPGPAPRPAAGERMRAVVAEVLDVAAQDVALDERLNSYGVLPEQLARIADALETATGFRPDAGALHEGTTVAELSRLAAEHIAEHTAADGPAGAPAEREPGGGATVPRPPRLADIARTLQLGRAALPVRAALVVRDLDELSAGLRALADGRELPANCWIGEAGRPGDVIRLFDEDELREAVDKWLDRGKLARVAELWVSGGPVDWRRLYGAGPVPRIPLPGYPFARHHHGLATTAPAPLPASTPADDSAPGKLAAATGSASRPAAPTEPTPVAASAAVAGDSVQGAAESAEESATGTSGAVAATGTGVGQPSVPPQGRPAERPAMPDAVATASVGVPERLDRAMAERLVRMAADLVGVPADTVDAREQLDRYGIDSVTRTRLNHQLSEAFPDASRTLFFEYPKAEGVAAHLAERFPGACRTFLGWDGTGSEPAMSVPAQAVAVVPEPAPAGTGAAVPAGSGPTAPGAVSVPSAPRQEQEQEQEQEPEGADDLDGIAVIGMSGRFPGAADLDGYWSLLMEGRTAVTEIPADRWDWREHYDPRPEGADFVRKSHSKWGAFLDGFDAFDPELFRFTEQEARNTDPQVRLFLQECWKALEDAGYAPSKLPAETRGRIGVFAGGAKHGFQRLGSEGRLEMPRTSFGDMVNRVSFQFDLGGPSEAVDTACSSALVALHQAVENLRRGRCDMALAGAVNLYLHPSTYVELATVGLLSGRSDCASFGSEASGIVPGEGVAAVVLKPLRAALRDGDPVRAVIRGSAVNHNGRTIGFTSPSAQRQAEVIREALRDARVDARTVSYVEATANGSEIGDAVEMTALTQAFTDRDGTRGTYRVGSLKPNIGHAEAASGMAQLFKVVLALQHRTLPPTRLPEEFNPAIDFDRLPFELSGAPAPWEPVVVDGVTVPRRAGITGIGGGGTNAHLVVEEAPAPAPAPAPGPRGPVLVTLSAHTEERLAAHVDQWLEFLRRRPAAGLAAIARTLQVGRTDLTHRLAVVASGAEELTGHLTRWRRGRPGDAVVTGTAGRVDPAAVEAALDAGDLHALAGLWVRGAAVDWDRLYPDGAPGRVPGLPTYPFENRRCWIAPTAPAPAPAVTAPSAAAVPAPGTAGVPASRTPAEPPAGHPLLSSAVPLADGGVAYTGEISLDTHPWIADHTVSGTVLFPGTGFVEAALYAGRDLGCTEVEELTLEAPLAMPRADRVLLQVVVRPPDGGGSRAVEVHSRPARPQTGAEPEWTRHATGTLGTGAAGPDLDFTAWPPEGAEPLPVDGYYDTMAAAGYAYGPSFRALRAVWRRGDEVFAEAEAADAQDAGRYGLHPALLDSALHAMGFGEFVRGGGGLLPFSWSGWRQAGRGAATVRIRLTAAGTDAVRAQIADGSGRPVAALDSLVLRPVAGEKRTGPAPVPDGLFELDWTVLDTAGHTPGRWSVAGPDDLGLAPALRRAGVEVSELPGGTGLMSLAAGGPADDLPAALREATARALTETQRLLADDTRGADRLVVITRGAVATRAGEDVTDLVHAPVWGLLRAAQAEHPDRLLLVDTDDTDASLAALPAAVAAATAAEESQLALRAGEARVPRLARLGTDGALVPPSDGGAWRLDTVGAGTLENLALVPWAAADAPPAPGQLRIEVRAAGLNFRDVLGALGMYPGDLTLGAEGAGVVTAVGPSVEGFRVGDRVMGVFPSGLGPVCVADARTVAPVPDGWTFEQAAAVPVAFVTAYYGLVDVGGLGAGESVLVHAAAGGVGMAAVQLARHLGAEVFATASEGKWDAVRELGVPEDRLASSRDLGFADRFLETTGGRGVDVVLDSLAREYVDASLRLLPRGGRFVEMGKTDIRDPQEVATAHFGVRYRAFDVVDAGPQRIGEILREILGLFRQGVLTHLPRTRWDLRRAPEAFRFMSQARHIGKIVLTVPRRPDPDRTVLITGGTGVLGGMLARHLVTERGARHLVLLSRRGLDDPSAAGLARELTAAGAEVTVVACDVADRERLRRVLDALPPEHPLGTVVHTAGALDDGVFDAMTPERLATVLRPKAEGALNLHELTRERDLDAFVLFSGAAGVLGNPGQSNYAAASCFLDALAQHRRAHGLPGTSLAWGYWEQATGLTRHLTEGDTGRMARGGLLPMSSRQGFELFDAACGADMPLQVPMRLDLGALAAQADAGEGHPLHRGLVRTARRPVSAPRESAPGLLAGASEEERRAALLDLVCDEVAAVLNVDPAAVGPGTGFVELGLDSLTAVELRNRLNRATGLRLPVTLVFDHPSPGPLADHLADRLTRTPRRTTPPADLSTTTGTPATSGTLATTGTRATTGTMAIAGTSATHEPSAAAGTAVIQEPSGTPVAPEPPSTIGDPRAAGSSADAGAPAPRELSAVAGAAVLQEPSGAPTRAPHARPAVRRALLRGEDLDRVGAVLEFGCRDTEGLTELARLHGELVVHGVTGDKELVDLGARELSERGLGDRVELIVADETLDPVPGVYDVVFAVHGCVRAWDKRTLFARLDAAVVDGGALLLADFVCTLSGDLVDERAGIAVPTAQAWAEQFARNRFVIDEVTSYDLTHPDPDLAGPLRQGWVVHRLFRLRKQSSVTPEERLRLNLAHLADPAAPARDTRN